MAKRSPNILYALQRGCMWQKPSLISLMHCREFACGNTLERGLQKCMLNAADLRTNCPANEIIPPQYFGNAAGASFAMPPDMTSLSLFPDPTAAGSSRPETGHKREGSSVTETGHKQQGSSSPETGPKQEVQSPVPSAEKCGAILAAAACAVRQGVQAFRTDPDSLRMQAASHMQQREQSVRAWLASPGFMPVRDAAVFVSSWRNMAVDEVDFGGGQSSRSLGVPHASLSACCRCLCWQWGWPHVHPALA